VYFRVWGEGGEVSRYMRCVHPFEVDVVLLYQLHIVIGLETIVQVSGNPSPVATSQVENLCGRATVKGVA
jgi:hypothetical protein